MTGMRNASASFGGRHDGDNGDDDERELARAPGARQPSGRFHRDAYATTASRAGLAMPQCAISKGWND